jgi:hypothetical protein
MSDKDQRPPGHDGDDAPDTADDVILSEQTALPGLRTTAPATTLTAHDLATPYVLDALEFDEREAFEHHLATCEACQQQVRDLEEAALLLPDALVSPPADLPDAFPFLLRDVAHETLHPVSDTLGFLDDEDPEMPEADDAGFTPVDDDAESDQQPQIADAIYASDEPLPADDDELAADVDEGDAPDAEDHAAAEPVTPPVYPTRPARPPGRIRPGVRMPAAGNGGGPATAARSMQITPATVAALAVGLVALGLFLWALLLLGRVGDLEDEIGQQNEEITTLRQQANATAYTLAPTTNGPAGASGTFFFSLPDQMGALVARGLDAAPNEWAYQIFYIDDDQSAPIAGPTFQVDENGEALIPLSADVASFDAVAISLEPAAGSPAPTSQVILQGRLGGAAG